MRNKIKIALIIPSLAAGGSERFISLLANHLNKTLFEVHLILIDGKNQFYNIDDAVKIYDLKTARVRNSIFKIQKIILNTQPEIVFSTLGYLNLTLAIFRFLFPRNTVFIARESSVIKASFSGIKKIITFPFFKNLYKAFFPKIDIAVCQSIDIKKSILDLGVKHNRMIIINNPIDIPNVQIKALEESTNSTHYDIVSIGRLTYQKGYDRLIQGIAAYKKKYGTMVKVAIIGEGSERSKLTQTIQQLGLSENIHLLGRKKNPFIYFDTAKLFLMTSRFEGFPNVLLEAGACGLPIVAFQAPGGLNEIIQEGKNGFLVPENDLDGLCTSIYKAMNHPFDKKWIINNTKDKFGLPVILKIYEKLFIRAVL